MNTQIYNVVVDTRFRTNKEFSTPANCRVELNRSIQYTSISLKQIIFTNNIYNVNDYNNTFYIEQSTFPGVEQTITIPAGIYNGSTFLQILKDVLEAQSTTVSTYTVEFQEGTNKLKITSTTPFKFVNIQDDFTELMGFIKPEAYQLIQVSSYVPNLVYPSLVNFSISSHATHGTTYYNNQVYSFCLPLSQGPLSTIYADNNNILFEQKYERTQQLDHFTLRLSDFKGRDIINDGNYVLVFEITN